MARRETLGRNRSLLSLQRHFDDRRDCKKGFAGKYRH